MQGKGVVKFFLVVMTLVCLVQYLLIIPTRKVEKAAENYAEVMAAEAENEEQKLALVKQARINYLDSMSSEEIFSLPLIKSYTYEELKKQQLALGLDLKGGMSVVLQVDLKDFLSSLSNNSNDPTFLEALDNAQERLESAQTDYITLFVEEFRKLDEDKTLANIFMRNTSLRESINFETSDAEVIRIVRDMANETVDLTFKRLKDRIDKLGVVQPNVSLDAARHLILVELPGIDNPERARGFLQSTAKLEFWDIYRVSDPGLLDAFIEADQRLKREQLGLDTVLPEPQQVRYDTTWVQRTDSLGNVDSVMEVAEVPVEQDVLSDRGPLLSAFDLNINTAQGLLNPLSVMGITDKNKRDLVMNYLEKDDIARLFPADILFRWSRKPVKDYETGNLTNRYYLYALKKKRGSDTAPLEGDRVVRASSSPDPITNEVGVSLKMDNQGAKVWADMTTRAAQDNNREIAIVLDDEVVSAPRVNEPILSGDSQIHGDFTVQEGQDLANILQIGKLPAKTKIIQEATVGPSLGKDNISRSLKSLIIGFALVLLFMILYYGGGGIVSIIALFANLFFIFGALASYGTVLTLPGIAGIVLTIGMAVDANVIIYERVREELHAGKGLLLGIKDGFKNSYSAIIDKRICSGPDHWSYIFSFYSRTPFQIDH
jgi:SecD/SecF fusion protein